MLLFNYKCLCLYIPETSLRLCLFQKCSTPVNDNSWRSSAIILSVIWVNTCCLQYLLMLFLFQGPGPTVLLYMTQRAKADSSSSGTSFYRSAAPVNCECVGYCFRSTSLNCESLPPNMSQLCVALNHLCLTYETHPNLLNTDRSLTLTSKITLILDILLYFQHALIVWKCQNVKTKCE